MGGALQSKEDNKKSKQIQTAKVSLNRKGRFIMMGYLGYGGFSWIGMIVNMVIMLAIVVGIVLLVIWSTRRTHANAHQSGIQGLSSQSAKDIAQARYAKGEITRDEYQQILTDLGK
jgi:putative membrane protein